MADTDKYKIVKSEFVFTNEGRHLLISQEGGIKFAILGYMFVQGLPFISDDEEFVVNKKTFKGFSGYVHYIDSIAKDKKLSIMDVLQDKTLLQDNISFVLKNVSYKIKSPNSVAPINEEQYTEALENYSENLFGMYYVPTNEFMLKKQEDGSTVPYGLYRFNFDRTYLSCNITKDLAFSHIALIGKQYAETDDATFNVNEVQKASIVAFAQFDGKVEKSTGIYDGGVQILANQNKYVSFQTQLRFTVREDKDEEDISPKQINEGKWSFDIPSAVSGTAQKLYLINNGLKTIRGGVAIGYDKPVLDELQLDQDGSIAIDKSIVAADCIDADDAENQFNAAALFHGINKYPEDGGKYIPQYLLTTVKATSSLKEDIEAYCGGMQLNGIGVSPYSLLGKDASPESPTFILGHLPENDLVAVDIFGRDNFKNQYSKDRFLFSFDNSATQPNYGEPNVLFKSHGNSFIEGASMNNNMFIDSNRNRASYGIANNTLINSDENLLTNGLHNAFILNSKRNNLSAVDALTMINGYANHIGDNASDNTLICAYTNSAFGNAKQNILFNARDNALSGNTMQNMLIRANENVIDQNCSENFLVNTNQAKVTWDSRYNVFNFANNISARAANRDLIDSTNYAWMQATSNNRVYNAFKFSGYSAQNNVAIGARFFGLYPNGSTQISGVERPLASDNQSNNNYIMNASYATLFGCSDNMIIDTYGLRSNDSVVDPGPVRVKGSSIIGSDGSKLYNAREVRLLNSIYSKVDGHSDYSDEELGLNGTSWIISERNTGILDSVLAGEYSGGSGLSGTSFREGAESISTHGRPADMLRLRTQFINTYGSELNLSEYIPSEHYTASVTYSPYQAFKNQNKSVMEDSIKPQNSVILGGHHNKLIGGENVTFIGAEYSKASGKAHQVIMGKYNRDCAADLIYGCGHFDGDSYIQNEKEYSVSELKTIETMNGTIQNVRASSKLENALEFYAHQGKMILRNCDDGYDRNNGARSNAYGMSVTLDPTGIQFRDGNDKIIGEMYADDLKKDSETIIYVDFQDPVDDTTDGYFYVSDYDTSSDALKKYWASMTPKQRFDSLFNVGPTVLVRGTGKGTTEEHVFSHSTVGHGHKDPLFNNTKELTDISNALYDNQNSRKIKIIFSDFGIFKYNNHNNNTVACYVELYFKGYPYYTEPNKACRYMGKAPCELKIYYMTKSGRVQSAQDYMKILVANNEIYEQSTRRCTDVIQYNGDSESINHKVTQIKISQNETVTFEAFANDKYVNGYYVTSNAQGNPME